VRMFRCCIPGRDTVSITDERSRIWTLVTDLGAYGRIMRRCMCHVQGLHADRDPLTPDGNIKHTYRQGAFSSSTRAFCLRVAPFFLDRTTLIASGVLGRLSWSLASSCARSDDARDVGLEFCSERWVTMDRVAFTVLGVMVLGVSPSFSTTNG